ncbi:MAG: helix-turn-helix domain-containing protein [Mycobacteriaceae bacterium]
MIHAQALSDARSQLGVSQRKLARTVGLNYQVIRRLESGGDDGNLTLRDFGKICATLGVAPSALLSAPELAPVDGLSDQLEELDLGQARLLRRIQRGQEVRKALRRDQQELVLPSLLRLGLVITGRSGALNLSHITTTDFPEPDSLD